MSNSPWNKSYPDVKPSPLKPSGPRVTSVEVDPNDSTRANFMLEGVYLNSDEYRAATGNRQLRDAILSIDQPPLKFDLSAASSNELFVSAMEQCFTKPSYALAPLAAMLATLLGGQRRQGKCTDQEICAFLTDLQRAALSERVRNVFDQADRQIAAEDAPEIDKPLSIVDHVEGGRISFKNGDEEVSFPCKITFEPDGDS